MNMNKLLKSSIEITGKIPLLLKNKLESAGVLVDGLITGGNNINVTLNSKGTETTIEATFVGNGKWVVDNLDDAANLFPEIEEGDSVSADMFTKLFMNSINSGLILSFNPLGRVKYGIKEVGKNIADVGRKVADWATDKLYAEDAEKWIRGNGPYRRTFTDARDGKTRTKKDYSAGRVNVGKIESLGKMGHYKVLSGNPATQDFQVWHLYKNGNKIRCLDVKTGLKPQEAQWVYDNNIPDSWSEADWNPEGEIPEKASKIEVQEVPQTEEDNVNQTEESQTEETTEEDNTTEESQATEDNADTTEEDNVTEEDSESEEIEQTEEDNIGNPDDWWDESDTDDEWNEDMEYVQMDEEDNVVEEPKKKKKKVTAAFVKSSIEDSDSDFDGDVEEDNVIESKPKKKSKYNGKNVTGYQDGMLGTMTVASSLISCSLILSKIEDFQNYIKQYKLEKKPKQVLTEILTRLRKLPAEDRNNITKDSNNNVLIINFGNTDLTTENYMAQFEIYDDDVVSKVNLGKGNNMTGDDAIRMCTQTLDSIINP